ncbi:hypothetical protein [Vibrio phage S4-7]|nr:hypothetical protein [Vibrio phage S4-7]
MFYKDRVLIRYNMNKREKRYERCTNYFYILQEENFEVLKIGITCTLANRITRLQGDNRKTYNLLHCISFPTRTDAESFERTALYSLKRFKITPEWVVSGKREHLSIDALPYLQEMICEKPDIMSYKMFNPFVKHHKLTSRFVSSSTTTIRNSKSYKGEIRISKPRCSKREFNFIKILLLELKFCKVNDIGYIRVPYKYVYEVLRVKIPFTDEGVQGVYCVDALSKYLSADMDEIPYQDGESRFVPSTIKNKAGVCNYTTVLYHQEVKLPK